MATAGARLVDVMLSDSTCIIFTHVGGCLAMYL